MLETSNIDLAAYLKVRGQEPVRVRIGERGFRTFAFPDEPAKTIARSFWEDDYVPVRQFTMARVALKRLEATER